MPEEECHCSPGGKKTDDHTGLRPIQRTFKKQNRLSRKSSPEVLVSKVFEITVVERPGGASGGLNLKREGRIERKRRQLSRRMDYGIPIEQTSKGGRGKHLRGRSSLFER